MTPSPVKRPLRCVHSSLRSFHTMSPGCEHCLPASFIKTNTILSTGDVFSFLFPPGAVGCVCFVSRCRQHESVSTCKPITRFRVSLLPDWLSTNQSPATAANYFTRSACAQVGSWVARESGYRSASRCQRNPENGDIKFEIIKRDRVTLRLQ